VVWKIVSRDAKSIQFATQISLGGAPLEIHKRYEMKEEGRQLQLNISSPTAASQRSGSRGSVIMSPSDMVGPGLDYKNSTTFSKESIRSMGITEALKRAADSSPRPG
jgi:hypothetical protein